MFTRDQHNKLFNTEEAFSIIMPKEISGMRHTVVKHQFNEEKTHMSKKEICDVLQKVDASAFVLFDVDDKWLALYNTDDARLNWTAMNTVTSHNKDLKPKFYGSVLFIKRNRLG